MGYDNEDNEEPYGFNPCEIRTVISIYVLKTSIPNSYLDTSLAFTRNKRLKSYITFINT